MRRVLAGVPRVGYGGLNIALLIPAFAALFSAAGTAAWMWHVPTWLADGVCLLIGGAIFWSLRAPGPSFATDDTDGRQQAAFWTASAIALACAVSHLLRFPDGAHDAWIIWNLRAKWLFRAAPGAVDSAFSPDILFWAHTDYPLLLPRLITRGYRIAGGESAAVPALVGILFGACAVAIVVAYR